MSIFGNDQGDGVGTKLVPDVYTEGNDGFAAMGKPVPFYRRDAAMSHCKDMGCSTETAFDCVNGMAELIARDKPMAAMDVGYRYVDVTGVYRLLAVLCTAPKPVIRVKAGSQVI